MVVLMFDIIDSRCYSERLNVQETLFECIEYLNKQYSEQIKRPVVVSAGDEFQGLFYKLQVAYAYVRQLQLLIYPIELRCAISSGNIKYDVDNWQSNAFDGEAYYLCRDAINAVSSNKKNIICFNTSSKYDKYLNVFCRSSSNIKAKQKEVAHTIELLADIAYPLFNTDFDSNFYLKIDSQKESLLKNETCKMVIDNSKKINLCDIQYKNLYSVSIQNKKLDQKPSFIMDDFWAHGMSTYIAEAMNTSRQNIDKYIESGKIKESRTLDKTIFDYLGEIECNLQSY